MDASDKLRDRAARLFALALTAREGGMSTAVQIDDITDLANEALSQAEDMDRVAWLDSRNLRIAEEGRVA
jgi:hypothetical protein